MSAGCGFEDFGATRFGDSERESAVPSLVPPQRQTQERCERMVVTCVVPHFRRAAQLLRFASARAFEGLRKSSSGEGLKSNAVPSRCRNWVRFVVALSETEKLDGVD